MNGVFAFKFVIFFNAVNLEDILDVILAIFAEAGLGSLSGSSSLTVISPRSNI